MINKPHLFQHLDYQKGDQSEKRMIVDNNLPLFGTFLYTPSLNHTEKVFISIDSLMTLAGFGQYLDYKADEVTVNLITASEAFTVKNYIEQQNAIIKESLLLNAIDQIVESSCQSTDTIEYFANQISRLNSSIYGLQHIDPPTTFISSVFSTPVFKKNDFEHYMSNTPTHHLIEEAYSEFKKMFSQADNELMLYTKHKDSSLTQILTRQLFDLAKDYLGEDAIPDDFLEDVNYIIVKSTQK